LSSSTAASQCATGSPSVSFDQLVAGFAELGLTPGMGVMVHSSLSSFGYVEGGPATVVRALMTTLTSDGLLLMPSFNHGAPFGFDGVGYYDPDETPTTNGAIPDHFWRLPDVFRSLNPTHPFAAWGEHASDYVATHHRTLTMGLPDAAGAASPLGYLYADDGYGLLLGVDYTSNTFHHVVEMATGAPCLGLRTEVYPVHLSDGREVLGRTWGWRARSCPFTDGNRYADRIAAKQRVITIGRAVCILYRLRDCFDVVAEILDQGRDGFPSCDRCPIRPRWVRHTIDSDWSAASQRLLPGSIALTY
jgi:aminoglycoside 3-N-acetyltransferase